jgi:hypothetical protein
MVIHTNDGFIERKSYMHKLKINFTIFSIEAKEYSQKFVSHQKTMDLLFKQYNYIKIMVVIVTSFEQSHLYIKITVVTLKLLG